MRSRCTRLQGARFEAGCNDGFVASLADRILDAVGDAPLDDDALAKRLGVRHRQAVNQAARRLQSQGRLSRFTGVDGKIVNALPDGVTPQPSAPPRSGTAARGPGDRISEDEVKEAVRAFLAAQGFDVEVAWGRARGIDIDAQHPDGSRFVIEAKAEVGHSGAQQVNYFLGMLGELVQRMNDPRARYGIALPANRQYRGLVDRVPALARERLRLVVFWVSRKGDELRVQVEP